MRPSSMRGERRSRPVSRRSVARGVDVPTLRALKRGHSVMSIRKGSEEMATNKMPPDRNRRRPSGPRRTRPRVGRGFITAFRLEALGRAAARLFGNWRVLFMLLCSTPRWASLYSLLDPRSIWGSGDPSARRPRACVASSLFSVGTVTLKAGQDERVGALVCAQLLEAARRHLARCSCWRGSALTSSASLAGCRRRRHL